MWNLFLLWNVHHFSLSFFSVSCFVIRYDGFLFFSLVSSFESSIECTKCESTTKLTEKKETSYESYMLHLKAQLDIAGEKYTHTHTPSCTIKLSSEYARNKKSTKKPFLELRDLLPIERTRRAVRLLWLSVCCCHCSS